MTACGSSATPAPTSTPTTATSSIPAASTSAAARLVAALKALGSGYTFDTKVTVAGHLATHATGRWFGGASEFTITSAGGAITYRAVPPRAWVQQANGTWVETAAAASSGDPLSAFTKPLTVTAVAGSATDLQVVYRNSALGLTGTGSVAVAVTLASDGSISLAYSTGSGSTAASATTVLAPAASQTPISPPPS